MNINSSNEHKHFSFPKFYYFPQTRISKSFCPFNYHVILVTKLLQLCFILDLEKEFRGLPSDVDVAVGSSVVLSCQAPKGNPSPSVTWKKDGKVYHVGEGSRLDGDSLVINSVSKDDAGGYQCRAVNIATIRETPTVHLGVHGKLSRQENYSPNVSTYKIVILLILDSIL